MRTSHIRDILQLANENIIFNKTVRIKTTLTNMFAFDRGDTNSTYVLNILVQYKLIHTDI